MKNKRQNIKRHIDEIIGKVEKSRDELVALANIYNEHHPEYAELFFSLAAWLDKFPPEAIKLRDII